MRKKIVCNLLLLLFAVSILLIGCESMGQVSIDNDKLNEYLEVSQEKAEVTIEDLALTDLTGAKSDYAFIYDGNPYLAKYTPDNWEIIDSYKITNTGDMAVICQALINEHPIHGRDMVSYRTADDMAYEWEQHNVVYYLLPEDNRWIESVKSVDFDPEDQGKSYEELYEDRTGKKLDIKEILRKVKKLGNRLQGKANARYNEFLNNGF